MQSYLPIRNSLVGINCRISRDIFLNFLDIFAFVSFVVVILAVATVSPLVLLLLYHWVW